jgi:hypothetical protein
MPTPTMMPKCRQRDRLTRRRTTARLTMTIRRLGRTERSRASFDPAVPAKLGARGGHRTASVHRFRLTGTPASCRTTQLLTLPGHCRPHRRMTRHPTSLGRRLLATLAWRTSDRAPGCRVRSPTLASPIRTSRLPRTSLVDFPSRHCGVLRRLSNRKDGSLSPPRPGRLCKRWQAQRKSSSSPKPWLPRLSTPWYSPRPQRRNRRGLTRDRGESRGLAV